MGDSEPVIIELGNEKKILNNWIPGKPLKVITHGWFGSDKAGTAVFAIKTGMSKIMNQNPSQVLSS